MNSTIRRTAKTGRRALRVLLGATVRPTSGTPARNGIRNGIPSAAPVAEQSVADEQAHLFAADELPPLADIAAAAREYMAASEQTRAAERTKRAARKLLDRLPAGRYGAWQVERVGNAREVADLEAIRAIFDAYNLGEVPMKRVAPSLKVVIVPELANVAGLVAA